MKKPGINNLQGTAGLSDLAKEDIEYVGAHRERARLFELLGSQTIDDETRLTVRKEYAAAADRFDELRAALLKPKGK